MICELATFSRVSLKGAEFQILFALTSLKALYSTKIIWRISAGNYNLYWKKKKNLGNKRYVISFHVTLGQKQENRGQNVWLS